jgi:hypothetical protein
MGNAGERDERDRAESERRGRRRLKKIDLVLVLTIREKK